MSYLFTITKPGTLYYFVYFPVIQKQSPCPVTNYPKAIPTLVKAA